MTRRRKTTVSIACCLFTAGTLLAQEDAATPAPYVPQSANQAIDPKVNPDANLRERLTERGISVGLSYIGEGFTNWKGGTDSRRGKQYLGSLVPTLSVDFARLGLGRGEFFMSAQAIHGHGINDARVGAIQTASNLDAKGFGKFIEVWYGDSYLGGKIKVKAGRQYADSDFGLVENGGTFLNSSYGLMPTTPMPTFPDPKLGANVWVAPASWISWGVGVYQGGTLDPVSEDGSPLRQSPFTVFETRLEPFRKNSTQQGSYRFGVWQQARGAWLSMPAQEGIAEPVRNYGMYAAADHWFVRTDSDEHHGPGVFGQWGWTPSDRNEITGYTGGGFVYQGLLPRRKGDIAGIGITRARLATARIETVYELFYKLKINDKLMLQPDLQWFRNPGGNGPHALVAGMRLGIEF